MINRNWIFGNKCGLDFSTNPPTATSGNSINTGEGCASISDKNGNLLFYTDGVKVWDSAHTERYSALLGDSSSTQSAIIVPDPANSDQYYIFTTDGSSNSSPPFNHFNGVLVNVVSWSITPITDFFTLPDTTGLSPTERITAIQHKNCKDFWVISILQKGDDDASSGSGIFRIFKIDSSGIHHHSDIPMSRDIGDMGYLKSSSNLQLIALADTSNRKVLIYPFDNALGLIDITGVGEVPRDDPAYGVEFSPNCKFLYYSTLAKNIAHGFVYQVELNVLTSIQVGDFPNKGGRYAIGALQLGIDDRIYIAKDGENSLGAIEKPNLADTACTVTNTFIQLPKGSTCHLGLPNLLPNACKEDDCDCGCNGCNKDADKHNEELIARAKGKYNTVKSKDSCDKPFIENCELSAVEEGTDFSPCFYFHWGDGSNDQIEEHDTEVFYLTVCNKYNDIGYRGLKITKVTLIPDIHPLEKIHIVPDRFISIDCLKPCTCQTREFAIITRANDTAGDYTLEVEYCYEEIVFASHNFSGIVKFPITITED